MLRWFCVLYEKSLLRANVSVSGTYTRFDRSCRFCFGFFEPARAYMNKTQMNRREMLMRERRCRRHRHRHRRVSLSFSCTEPHTHHMLYIFSHRIRLIRSNTFNNVDCAFSIHNSYSQLNSDDKPFILTLFLGFLFCSCHFVTHIFFVFFFIQIYYSFTIYTLNERCDHS